MSRTKAAPSSKSAYSLHPGLGMEEKVVQNLKVKTGRTLEEWIALLTKSGPATRKDRVLWLKQTQGLGTNYAVWIAERAETGQSRAKDYDPESLVERMFSGPRAGLRPIYDRLIDLALTFGSDVTISPCATMVPLRRRYVFAQIKPAAKARVDLGLALAKAQDVLPARLIDTGGLAKGDRITHRIPLGAVGEIDAQVRRWFKLAYDLDA